MRKTPIVVVIVLVVLAATVRLAWESTTPFDSPIRGITVSTHGSGRDWGDDTIVPTFEELRDLGATWVATHPYARIRADGTVGFRRIDPQSPPQWLVRPIREAHALGLKIMIKPHLAYWGSPFSWRGEIRFDEEDQWQHFFETYRQWITDVAQACRDADVLVVGTELDATLQHETQWRQIIDAVRQETGAYLTYAANWTDYQNVGFWDDLDFVGIQAYFPLTQDPTDDPAELKLGWDRIRENLRSFSQQQGRPVLFTEVGYNRSFDAAVEPWQYRVDGHDATATQVACLSAALTAVAEEPAIVGAFLWKWFPVPHSEGRDFQLASPGMRSTIERHWTR